MYNLFLLLTEIFLVLAGLGMALFFWYRKATWRKLLGPRLLDSVFLQVGLPQEERRNEKELFAAAEQFFNAFVRGEKRSLSSFLKMEEILSFEIVSFEKKISFLVNCPKQMRDLVEKQIRLQYPTVQIKEVLPPKILLNPSGIAAVELGLQKNYVFPFKTYKRMEADPLGTLTGNLSKLNGDETGVIQLVLGPVSPGWRSKSVKVASEIQKGASLGEETSFALKILTVIFKGLGEAAKSFLSSKKTHEQLIRERQEKEAKRQLTPVQQDAIVRLQEKAAKNAFEANLRVVISSTTADAAAVHMRNILSSFMQFREAAFNGFRVRRRLRAKVVKDFLFRAFNSSSFHKMIINTEEITSIFHFHTQFPEALGIEGEKPQ